MLRLSNACKRSIFPLLLTVLPIAASPVLAEPKPTFGWVEHGLILPEKTRVKFKLDTGALTSSMHAENIDRFKKDGDDWVRFTVELEDTDTDKKVETRLERKVIRTIKVRGAGGADSRPVVMMKVCLGNRVYEDQFSLNDRDKMNYPVLIGRRMLEDVGLVDSSKTFTTEPNCKTGSKS